MGCAKLLSQRITSSQFTNTRCRPLSPYKLSLWHVFHPRSCRHFSNSTIRKSRWETWNPWRWNRYENRPWTREETDSMKDHHPILGVPVSFLPRHKLYRRPFPSQKEKAEQLLGWGMFDIVLLICVSYQAFGYYYNDPPIFRAPKFTPFSIISKEKVSATSFIVTLRPEPYVLNSKLAKIDPYMKEWEKGTWSVEFKQPQLQIARSYTPLPPRRDDLPGDLRFLIREEANGEMSRYVARLSEGDKIDLRGPHTEVELPKDVTNVLFLAGGTGIAPALQVAYTLLEAREQRRELPYIHIAWANRRREDCLGGSHSQASLTRKSEEGVMVQELLNLQNKYPNNVRVDCLVDEEGTFLDQKMITTFTTKSSDMTEGVSPKAGSRLLFVSGPEGFVNFLAGPKKYWDGKQLQGDLGGLIGKMGIRGWEVWKQ